ncbi:MAG: hypothetical protein R6U46_08195 [Marinilabilia sp.]
MIPGLLVFILLTSISCGNNDGRKSSSSGTMSPENEIADTIIYPVDVINLDSADKWADTRLKRLDQEKMTDMFFDALYDGDARALDYYTREPIPAEEIKEMEESGKLDRKEMGQLQFEESWFFDPETAQMTKEVQSVLLAWPVFDNDGEFQAYEAGFVLELNP